MMLVKLVEFSLVNDVNNDAEKHIYGAFESWLEIRRFLNECWNLDGNKYSINELAHCMVDDINDLYENHSLGYVDELVKDAIFKLIVNDGICYGNATINMNNW